MDLALDLDTQVDIDGEEW